MARRRQRSDDIVAVRNTENNPHRDPTLLEWDELPEWQRDIEHLISGYRPPSFSFSRSFQSMLAIHNETVNIHSHLLGAVLFFGLSFVIYQRSSIPSFARAPDLIVFSTFFFGTATCFLLSSIFHVCANHSPRVNVLGNQLDYLGILILMWGSAIPSIYYGFYCDPSLQKWHWWILTALASACIFATFHRSFRHPSPRPYRALMYAGLGLSALGFISHGLLLFSWETQNQRMSLDWMGTMAVLNLTGAMTYAARLPERLSPRRYDIFGNSHQILHVMVVLAALAHMFGLFRAFDHVHAESFSCNDKS